MYLHVNRTYPSDSQNDYDILTRYVTVAFRQWYSVHEWIFARKSLASSLSFLLIDIFPFFPSLYCAFQLHADSKIQS